MEKSESSEASTSRSFWSRSSSSQSTQPAQGRWSSVGKRSLDVSVAIAFLILFSPLLVGVVLLVLAAEGRPVFFGHRRVGRNGRSFTCYKFRTMVKNPSDVLEAHLAANPAACREWEVAQKLKDDPRVTALGRVMRKLSVDELPQFLNVLRGDMSLVGPRPIVSAEARFYGHHIADYCSVRPGITGLWQVNGRSNTSYDRRVALDVEYARGWSISKDVIILVKTIPAVLLSDGSY